MLFTFPLRPFVWFSCSVCQNWSHTYFPAEYSHGLIRSLEQELAQYFEPLYLIELRLEMYKNKNSMLDR